MKITKIFLILLIYFEIYFSLKCTGVKKTNWQNCKLLDTDEPSSHCCFGSYEINGLEYSACVEITDDNFKNMKNYILNTEKNMGQNNKIKTLDCSGTFKSIFSFYLFVLILIL